MRRSGTGGTRGETVAGRQTAARIMEAAVSLFARNGFAATSVSMICAEADVSATSLYHLFGSKEGLLRAVIDDAGERWLADQRSLQESSGKGLDEASAMFESHLDMLRLQFTERPALLRMLYMLSLERGREDSVSLGAVRGARRMLVQDWLGVLSTLRPDLARDAVAERAELVLAVLDGVFFASEIEADTRAGQRLVDGIRLIATA